MQNLHHKPVKRFNLEGTIHDESAIGRLKNEYIRLLTVEMRLNGYVPRLDINPDFTIYYNNEKQYFEFILSVYGVYVGKRKSEWIEGVDETRAISTPKSKSSVSSSEVV
jgi:hypothetical protein